MTRGERARDDDDARESTLDARKRRAAAAGGRCDNVLATLSVSLDSLQQHDGVP